MIIRYTSYKEAVKAIAELLVSNRQTPEFFTTHDENDYIIGASQALMVVFHKNPDEVERDIRMAVRALELEEE